MNRFLLLITATLALSACTLIDRKPADYENPFYAKYLSTGSALDAQITSTLEQLRQDPESAALHNELGSLLVQKGFPKDAEREFERAVDADRRFYQGWYNLGLVRAARGDEIGARRAFRFALKHKPGHSQALFQLGLIEEKRHNTERAVKLYAKAYRINPSLLSVSANPRILDSNLTHLALLELYPSQKDRRSMQFQGAPVAPPAPPPPATSTAPPAPAKPPV